MDHLVHNDSNQLVQFIRSWKHNSYKSGPSVGVLVVHWLSVSETPILLHLSYDLFKMCVNRVGNWGPVLIYNQFSLVSFKYLKQMLYFTIILTVLLIAFSTVKLHICQRTVWPKHLLFKSFCPHLVTFWVCYISLWIECKNIRKIINRQLNFLLNATTRIPCNQSDSKTNDSYEWLFF